MYTVWERKLGCAGLSLGGAVGVSYLLMYPCSCQATAETVYDILSPTSPVTRTLLHKKYARKLRRGQQPADLREGVAKAYDTFREVWFLPVLRPVPFHAGGQGCSHYWKFPPDPPG